MAGPTPPLPAYSFRATVDGQSAAFSEVSGLTVERETATYNHGLSHWEGEVLLTFASAKHRQISLKRGVFAGDGQFFSWLMGEDAEAKPMDVSLCDATGAPAVTWRIARAIPIKLTAPSFSASTNEVAVETLDVMVSGVSVVQGT